MPRHAKGCFSLSFSLITHLVLGGMGARGHPPTATRISPCCYHGRARVPALELNSRRPRRRQARIFAGALLSPVGCPSIWPLALGLRPLQQESTALVRHPPSTKLPPTPARHKTEARRPQGLEYRLSRWPARSGLLVRRQPALYPSLHSPPLLEWMEPVPRRLLASRGTLHQGLLGRLRSSLHLLVSDPCNHGCFGGRANEC